MTDEKFLDDFSECIDDLEDVKTRFEVVKDALRPVIAEFCSLYDWVRRRLERR